MTDSKQLIKKSVKRKKHLRVVEVLKKLVEVTTITKRILNLRVNLTNSKLLAFPLAIEKQLTKVIIEEKVIQFQVNSLDLGKVFKVMKLFL